MSKGHDLTESPSPLHTRTQLGLRFPNFGIDSGNAPEVINERVFAKWSIHSVPFPRPRAASRINGAHVEQKKGTHVREPVGCLHCDCPPILGQRQFHGGSHLRQGSCRAGHLPMKRR